MRTIRAALALVFAASLFSAAAAATAHAETQEPSEGHQEEGRKFPMPAADFRAHVSARIDKARARMEGRIHDDQLPQDKADAVRAGFKAAVDQINAKVEQVCADGTVTKEEALEVRALSRSLLHHHHRD